MVRPLVDPSRDDHPYAPRRCLAGYREFMLVRAFAETDRSAVVALWHEAGLTRPWNDPEKDIDRALATWPDLFLVAEQNGAVIGTALCG
jgi:hypothetical protein